MIAAATHSHRSTARSNHGADAHRPTVCQLLHGLPVGGAEVLASRMARQLSDRYRFVFACLDRVGELGEALMQEGFAVHLLNRRPGLDIRCAWRLARFLREQHVEILHAHQYTPFFYGLMTRFCGSRVPLLFTEHGRWFPDYPRRKRIIFNRLMLGRRDRVIGVGNSVRQALIDNEGIPANRVNVIYNGINLQPYRALCGRATRESVLAELGVAPGDFLILQVARLDHLKDHCTAVRTMERVVARHPRARLLIVGEGPERGTIEAEIAQRKLGEHVRLLGLRQDVPRLWMAADLGLLTSISEGIPLTLIEAMAAGRPVVSTHVGGIAEVVPHDETGFLAPSGDEAALADCVTRLIAEPGLAHEMGLRGRHRAEERFSEERMNAAYDRLYREMRPQSAAKSPMPIHH